MELVITIIIYIVIGCISFGHKKKTSGDRPERPVFHADSVNAEARPYREKIGSKGSTLLELESRHGDWLSSQLREEAVSRKRMSEMFELKQYHRNHCEAGALRVEHIETHNEV